MTLDSNFFKVDNIISPKQGKVLIAEPFLEDVNFSHSVVLLTEHNSEGTVGFVINNRVDLNINEVLNDFPDFNAPFSIGGPVGIDTVHFIHTLGDMVPNSMAILENLFWGGDFEELKILIKAGAVKSNQVRFFIGYSGWQPHQLEDEIEQNSWVVAELSVTEIMSYNEKSNWNQTLEKLGKKYRAWANFPSNPDLN
jgi:putative transcriptional regulator